VAGVVLCAYNVYVSQPRSRADLYAALTRPGACEAVTLGRKQLHSHPWREISSKLRLQDWPVPIVYEAAPIALSSPAAPGGKIAVSLQAKPRAARGDLAPNLPKAPDVGFFGRDETLPPWTAPSTPKHRPARLRGQRQDHHRRRVRPLVSLTGGVDGPVLFTSFEQYKTLPRVLDTLGQIFEGKCLSRAASIGWHSTDPQRAKVALQLLKQIPMLWIWTTSSQWQASCGHGFIMERGRTAELVDFFEGRRRGQRPVSSDSGRDERGWLGNLPTRILIPAHADARRACNWRGR